MYGMVSPDFNLYQNHSEFFNPPYYGASKAGIIGLTKSLSKEVGSRNITVNAIAPGFIKTEMTKELNENTGFTVSIKTLIGIGAAISTIIGMWFMLQADITEAKELPAPDVTRMEFDMKDQMIRQTILTTQEDVTEIKEDIKRIEVKIDQLN